jgi:hypothetical protein
MGFTSNAGTPAPRYPLLKGTANPFGLYPWSLLEARCVFLDGGDVTTETFTNGNGLQVLVFTCDVPVLFKAISGKAGTTSPYIFDVSLSENSTGVLVNEETGPATNATITNYGQVFRGYTATERVPCTGFSSGEFEVLVNGGGASVASSLDISVTALSGNIVAPISPTDHDLTAGTESAPLPIILRESDYTQAIADDGNRYFSAPEGSWFLVVGLWLLV